MGALRAALTRADHQQLQEPTRIWTILNAVLPYLTATAIGLGGAPRFSSDVWDGARQIAPWWCWSSAFLICGLLMTLENVRGNVDRIKVLNYITAVPYLFFGLGLLYATFDSPTAAYTGFGVYCWAAVMHTALAVHLPDREVPHAPVG